MPGTGAGGQVYLGPPPNSLIVVVDDLRWDDIGVAGHTFVQTPAIDQLAREGATLDRMRIELERLLEETG